MKRKVGKKLSTVKDQVVIVEEKLQEKNNTSDDGFLYLTGELFWKFKALDAEFRIAALAASNKVSEVAQVLMKNPGLVQLMRDRDELIAKSNECKQELQSDNKEIEEKLGMSLKKCTIDDKTGRIFVVEDDSAKKEIS